VQNAVASSAVSSSSPALVVKRERLKRESYFFGCLEVSFFSGLVSCFSGLVVLV
jgi:hypothetical protein